MKKEKKRKITLEQLKRKQKVWIRIITLAYLICFIIIIGGSIIETATGIKIYDRNYLRTVIIVMLLLFVYFLFYVDTYLRDKIQEEERKLKITKIKNKAKEGNLKSSVVLKSEDIQKAIILNNIEKIVLKEKEKANLIVEIYLKDGFRLSPIRISEEKILYILNQETKEIILDYAINSITIEDLEKTMQVKINTKSGYTIMTRADDFNLDAWFEIKE